MPGEGVRHAFRLPPPCYDAAHGLSFCSNSYGIVSEALLRPIFISLQMYRSMVGSLHGSSAKVRWWTPFKCSLYINGSGMPLRDGRALVVLAESDCCMRLCCLHGMHAHGFPSGDLLRARGPQSHSLYYRISIES
jgi:hypothetical protein